MSGFFRNVRAALETKYLHLNGLKGLRIKDMKVASKSSNADAVNAKQQYLQLQDSEEEFCKGMLYSNAHVLVTLESQDLWLICILHLHSPDFKNFQSTFEIKVDMNLQGNELRMHIQKLVITMWNNLCLQNLKDNDRGDRDRSSTNFFDDTNQKLKQQLFVLTQLDVFRFE